VHAPIKAPQERAWSERGEATARRGCGSRTESARPAFAGMKLARRCCVEGSMTSEITSEPTASSERRIERATGAIRTMSDDLAAEVAPRPSWIDWVSAATREAPIPALAVAFLIGVILARR
jgi:hypothetical protein